MVNSRVQVSCVIEEGDPPFRIRWYRNERPLIVQQPTLGGANRLLLASPSVSDASGGTGVRLTDFDAYSSILTIDQVRSVMNFEKPSYCGLDVSLFVQRLCINKDGPQWFCLSD